MPKDVELTKLLLLLNHVVSVLDVPSPFRDIERREGRSVGSSESSLASGHAIVDGGGEEEEKTGNGLSLRRRPLLLERFVHDGVSCMPREMDVGRGKMTPDR